MNLQQAPCPENHYHAELAERILRSYRQLLGRDLLPLEQEPRERYRALYEAPFCVLAHGTQADPIFCYGNQQSQAQFEVSWEELCRMPSRLSAEPMVQEERDLLLQQVRDQGYIDDYKGIRVSSTGRRFRIEKALVWNLFTEDGSPAGQAAALFDWVNLT